jgi:hypothetical protein
MQYGTVQVSGTRMVIHGVDSTATHFLNVDLDICSSRDLQALVTALGQKVMVLYVGRIRRTHRAHLELAKSTKTADAAIRGFCALIEALPKVERHLWNAARVRDFNIGVQAGAQPLFCEFILAAETLKAAYELGARIVFTVYAPEET